MTITEKEVSERIQKPPADLFTARNVKRCAIYIRVSTAEQRVEGWSLSAQEAGLRAEAEKKGWKVVGVYADEGKSARKRLRDRKAIHRLMEDVKAGLVDIIIFKELDRWFRSISDFYKIQDVLDQYGVEWFSQQQPSLEMRTKEGRLQVNVLLSVGQNETDAGSDRIKYTNKYLRQQKRWTSGAGNLPKCYTLDGEQRVLVDPTPGRADYTRALVDRVFRYGSVRKSVIETNAEYEGITSMTYNCAMSLLRNPMLYGEYKEVPDFVENPFMTKKEWDRLQGMIKRNAPDRQEHFYILSGLVRCAACGTTMSGTYTNGQYKKYMYYRCRKAALDGTCANKHRYSEIQLQDDLLQYVQDSVADQIAKVKAVKQVRKAKKGRKSNRETIEAQLDRLDDVYIRSTRMTPETYEKKKAAILAKLIPEDEPEEKLPELADLEKIQALFDTGVVALYQDFTPEERREFWRGILAEVRVEGAQIKGTDFIK